MRLSLDLMAIIVVVCSRSGISRWRIRNHFPPTLIAAPTPPPPQLPFSSRFFVSFGNWNFTIIFLLLIHSIVYMADLIGAQQQTLPANHFFIWVTKSRVEDFRGHLAHLNESETNRATYLIKERRSHANDSINLGKEWIEVVNSLLFRASGRGKW